MRFRDDRGLTKRAHRDGICESLAGQKPIVDGMGVYVQMRNGSLNDNFAGRTADMLRQFIEIITPIVDSLEDENNEEEALT